MSSYYPRYETADEKEENFALRQKISDLKAQLARAEALLKSAESENAALAQSLRALAGVLVDNTGKNEVETVEALIREVTALRAEQPKSDAK